MDDSFIHPEVPTFWKRLRKNQEETRLETPVEEPTDTVGTQERKDRFKNMKERMGIFGFSFYSAFI